MVKRHLIEQHSGVSHRCNGCHKFLGRADQKHGNCQEGFITTLVVRQTGETGQKAYEALKAFKSTVEGKIVPRLLPRNTLVPGQKAVKRPSDEAGQRGGKKWQQPEVTSPVARVAPPPAPRFVTSSRGVTSTTTLRSVPVCSPARMVATAFMPPAPVPIQASEPVQSVIGETPVNSSVPSDVEDGEIADSMSIAVGPQETLESTGPLTPIRVQVPPPTVEAVATTPTVAEAAVPGRQVVWDRLSATTEIRSVRLASWSDIQAGRVVLDIGGTKFVTSKATLRSEPSSLLAEMVRQGSPMRPFRQDDSGSPVYFLDRDPAHFRHVLNYLRLGNQWSAHSLPREVRYLYDLRAEADHFQLQGLLDNINSRIAHLRDSEYDDHV